MAYIEDLPSSGSTSLLKIRSMLQRALPTPLQHTTAVLKPHRVHRMEGVLLCKVLGTAASESAMYELLSMKLRARCS